MEESQKQAMIDAYKERLLSQANVMEESPMMQICLTAFRHGVENTLAEVEPKQQKLKKLLVGIGCIVLAQLLKEMGAE
jgi:hypothetical protein